MPSYVHAIRDVLVSREHDRGLVYGRRRSTSAGRSAVTAISIAIATRTTRQRRELE